MQGPCPFPTKTMVATGAVHLRLPAELKALLKLYLDSKRHGSGTPLLFSGLLKQFAARNQIDARFAIGKNENHIPGIALELRTGDPQLNETELGPFPDTLDIARGVIAFPELLNTNLLPQFRVDGRHDNSRLRIGISPEPAMIHAGSGQWPPNESRVLAEFQLDLRNWSNEKPGTAAFELLRALEWSIDLAREYRTPTLELLEFKKRAEKNHSRSFLNHVTQEGSFHAKMQLKIKDSTISFDSTIGRDLYYMLHARRMASLPAF